MKSPLGVGDSIFGVLNSRMWLDGLALFGCGCFFVLLCLGNIHFQ
jgi:hypothetical protein